MKHPEKIIESETPFQTGKRSTYMEYGALGKMLTGQSNGMLEQAIKDGEKGRIQLENLGNQAAKKLIQASELVERMRKISEPYMKDEDKL